jgi:hypothetical protein
MGSHPINLALRFVLEIAALGALGHWGWRQTDGWLRFVLAFGVPLLAAILWATFRVPNDPGVPPVAVPGIVRLALELGFFAIAIWALFATDATTLGWILSGAVALHYITSYDRMVWLMTQ